MKATQQRKVLESITVVRMVDCDPDTSYLGEYASEPDDSAPHTIDREERGDMLRGEYRYFNGGWNYKGEPPADITKYTEQDYERAESLNRGDWQYIGIRAQANIQINGIAQRITSGGLWGIESDSDESYFVEVARQELSDLRQQLLALGFTSRQIKAAMPTEIEFSDNWETAR